MVTVKMLSDTESEQLREKLQKYADLQDTGDLTRYLTELKLAGNAVEFRFFPTPKNGPVESVYLELRIEDSAPWAEDVQGNIRNGDVEQYQQLDTELNDIIEDVFGERVDFVEERGSGVFTAEVGV